MATDPIPRLSQDTIARSVEREVVRCFNKTCRLVQYRTKNNLCRRCRFPLGDPERHVQNKPLVLPDLTSEQPRVKFSPITEVLHSLIYSDRERYEELLGLFRADWKRRQMNSENREVVQNIGFRILRIRQSKRISQNRLHLKSGVTRSYLSRIESGQMIPSLGILEKIADAIGCDLGALFSAEEFFSLDDPFFVAVLHHMRDLTPAQWLSILNTLDRATEEVRTNRTH